MPSSTHPPAEAERRAGTPHTTEAGQSPGDPAPAADPTTAQHLYFPADLAGFLTELHRALQKHAMYPPAHPALRPAVARAWSALEPLLDERGHVTLEVGRRRIGMGQAETDPAHPIFRALAVHLHGHELAALSFRPGLTEAELSEVLPGLAADPRRSSRPMGKVAAADEQPWPHVILEPIDYEALGLVFDQPSGNEEEERQRAERLWRTLSRALLGQNRPGSVVGAALAPRDATVAPGLAEKAREVEAVTGAPAGDEAADSEEPLTPEDLAERIHARAAERPFARQALDGLLDTARQLRGVRGQAGRELAGRASRVLGRVEDDALRRLLAAGTHDERHTLLRDAAQWVEPPALVKLVRATGFADHRDLSNPLLLLLTKMARYSTDKAPDLSTQADGRFREQVERLVEGWEREDTAPPAYRRVLQRMALATPNAAGRSDQLLRGVEPDHVLRLGLLVDKLGPHVWNAVTTLMQGRRFGELLDALDTAPAGSPVPEEVWEELAHPRAVRWILKSGEEELVHRPRIGRPSLESRVEAATALPEVEDEEEGPSDAELALLDRFIARIGVVAAPPMLDALARAGSDRVRDELMVRLERLGPAVGPHLVERLEDRRSEVRRDMLLLMGRLEEWPRGWIPLANARDPRPEVRVEALKLLLRLPDRRDAAVCALLSEESPRARALGLAAAQQDPPPEAGPLLLHMMEDEEEASELRVLSVRALAQLRPDGLPAALLDLVAPPRGGLFRLLGPFRPRKLRASSPERLEALAALARRWPHLPGVRLVLGKARRSREAAVRRAARGETPARAAGTRNEASR